MFKRWPVFSILLLNLLHYITCDEVEDNPIQQISKLSNLTGSCSEYFQYQLVGDMVIGNLTLPQMKIDDNVMMQFLVRPKGMHTTGILLPDGSSEEVIERLQEKQPISFYVGFPVMDHVPELYKIFVNDKELCEAVLNNDLIIFVIRNELMIYNLQHTLNIRNGSIQVFTNNIHIPHFDEAANEPCGVVDSEIPIYQRKPLVFGGNLTIRGEFPWLVTIYEKHSTGVIFICGGSLVTSKHILSAAHCFQRISFNPEKTTTMLGRYDLNNLLEDSYITRDIKRIILHPNYKNGLNFSDADLALLIMKEHVSYTKYIKPICLWSDPADGSEIVNQIGVVVGWGRDKNDNNGLNVPKKLSMKIVSETECLRSAVGFGAITSPRTLCAGNRNGTGPCEGDSGGALMINRNGTWMVRGVTSSAFLVNGSCDLMEYTVYCDVAKHMTWLQENMRQQELLETGSLDDIKQQESLVTGSLDDICGISSSETRLAHPWLAAVYIHFPTGEIFICTGSLVSSRSVWLPDNCFANVAPIDIRRFRVYLGRYDLSNMNEKGVVLRKVESLISLRENKDGFIFTGNVALLQLKDPVSFTQYIKPICLWSPSQNLEQNIALTGWILLDVTKGVLTVPKSIEVNSSVNSCVLDTGKKLGPCILFLNVDMERYDRIRITKRNGQWLLLGECEYRSAVKDNETYCLFAYTEMADTMSWIRRNMLS